MFYYNDPYAVGEIISFHSENITKRVNNTTWAK